MAFDLQQTGAALRYGLGLKNALRDGALTQHLVSAIMQAEDAPQLRNRVDLDPSVKDVFGYPGRARHLQAARLRDPGAPLLRADPQAGARERRRHARLPGALRHAAARSARLAGTSWARCAWAADPATSVTNADGRFHDVDNLYACDGSVFPTSSGYNPTLTIIATSLKIAHGIAGAA